MPVVPTYPGVYIEEIPSGVHSITGVATSIAAFIGYTEQGPVDQPVPVFSYADYERAFGGLTLDSPVSYAVDQFFQNGGSQCYVVRVANGATSASLVLNAPNGVGVPAVIDITAAAEGALGNFLQIDIDYNTINPDSLFNLAVTQYITQNGQAVPGTSEMYRNLSMSNMNPNYFLPTINGASQLITVALDAAAAFGTKGYSQSGALTLPITIAAGVNDTIVVSIDGGTPQQLTLAPGALAVLNDVVNTLTTTLGFLSAPPTVTATANGVQIQSAGVTQASAVRFTNASSHDACGTLKLGLANGGIEVEGAAIHRPVPNGTLGGAILAANLAALTANAKINVDLFQARGAAAINTPSPLVLSLWGAVVPTTVAALVTAMNAAFTNAPASQQKYLAGTTVEVDTLLGTPRLRIVSGGTLPNIYLKFSDVGGGDTTCTKLCLAMPAAPPPSTLTPAAPDAVTNFGHYGLGGGTGDGNVPWLSAATSGSNGGVPAGASDYGDPLKKTGFYSLDAVDIFNILCLPDVSDNKTIYLTLYPDVLEYCTLRRAMMIIDLPKTVTTIAGAQAWMSGDGSSIVDSHMAAYFPRMMAADSLQNGNIHQFPDCGAVAGIWARTDGSRGVWKAPAGIETNILGATGLSYRMNNQENGELNPLGLNCLRTFPVFGTVVWGARTMRGADQLDDDYKYVPIRRLALFLEESLYRGSQWVVFEPNDEPLWAQIRLTIGSFMHALFRQGAFAGQTPKEAYFVRCDDETTTPLDQDQGRVNIIVGFAPLRPAEFVIIQIQQIFSLGPT